MLHADPPAMVQADVVVTEDALIERARAAVSKQAWVVGECAAEWTQRYSRGRSDADFAMLIGSSAESVRQKRAVWEQFGGSNLRTRYPNLRWSLYREALNWDDAHRCLEWAGQNDGTVAEMKAWRFYEGNGRDTGVDDDDPPQEQGRSDEPEQPRRQNAGKESSLDATGRQEQPADPGVVRRGPPEVEHHPPQPPDPRKQAQRAIEQINELLDLVSRKADHGQKQVLRTRLEEWVERLQPPEVKGGTASRAVVEAWNSLPDGVRKINALTKARKQKLSTRLKDPFWRENWMAAMNKVRTIRAMHGYNDRDWRATFDWFLRPDTVVQLIEGKYDGWKPTSRATATAKSNDDAFAAVFGGIQNDHSAEDVPF